MSLLFLLLQVSQKFYFFFKNGSLFLSSLVLFSTLLGLS